MTDSMPLGSAAKTYAQAALAASEDAETTWITDGQGRPVAAIVPCDVARRGDWRSISPPRDRDGLDAIDPVPGQEIQYIASAPAHVAGDLVPGPGHGWHVIGATEDGVQTSMAPPGTEPDAADEAAREAALEAARREYPALAAFCDEHSPRAGMDGVMTLAPWWDRAYRQAMAGAGTIAPADDSPQALSDAEFVASVLGLPVQRDPEPRSPRTIETSRGGFRILDQHGMPFRPGEIMTIDRPGNYYMARPMEVGTRWRVLASGGLERVDGDD